MTSWSTEDAILLPIVLILNIIISIIVKFALKNKSDKIKEIPRTAITVFLILFEVFKLLYNIIKGTFETKLIPLHFCSTFLFWFSLTAFTKGRLKKVGNSVGFIAMVMFLIMFYLFPNLIIGDASANLFKEFKHLHTFVFHNLIVLYFCLTISLKLYEPRLNHFIYFFISFTIYFIITVPLAHVLNANFTNFLYSDAKILQDILNSFGYPIYSIFIYVAGMIFAFLCCWVSSVLYTFINKKSRLN